MKCWYVAAKGGGAYPGCFGIVCYHEHEAEVDQVGPAADADDAPLQICLRLPNALKRRQDLWVLWEEQEIKHCNT